MNLIFKNESNYLLVDLKLNRNEEIKKMSCGIFMFPLCQCAAHHRIIAIAKIFLLIFFLAKGSD